MQSIGGGIRRFTDEVVHLWTSLADYYMRRSLFEKERDVFEEDVTSFSNVRGFSLIFDYSLIMARFKALEDEDEEGADLMPQVNGADWEDEKAKSRK
ncbi:hypothetical protein MPTK1_1g14970 [Marchantia polymorpha subsp. ruderalis]|nr:hypothetical protein MARPO_0033s0164 [Marchantia polymorpha]BBM98632.1 hypothetical protein Mp_1g14970 [Marchantia polymorpha subsp. ruderalis]|eukprot:PTQ41777.1 hypothetical protein MARPO_0033s0164 [Marchantia polymorpha]